MHLSKEQRIFVVLLCGYRLNFSGMQKEFHAKFGFKPHRLTLKRIKEKFLSTGSVEHKKGAGRPKNVRSQQNVSRVLDSIQNNGKQSLQEMSSRLGIQKSSIYRILKENNFKAYKMKKIQELKEGDPENRYAFFQWYNDKNEKKKNFSEKVIWTDEAGFRLNRNGNVQNVRMWAQHNPYFTVERKMKSKTLYVWAGIWIGGVIGPFFFDSTITGDMYLEILKHQIWPALQVIPNLQEMFFMQDGAPPHWFGAVRVWLDERFPNRWIGRDGPIPWSSRSPDLILMDFSVWGIIKNKVAARVPQDLTELKRVIVEEFGRLDQEYYRRICLNVTKRYRYCMKWGGAQAEHASRIH
jgi:hypothetical protein